MVSVIRRSFVLGFVAFVACTGGGNGSGPDAGAEGPPAGWTCDPQGYGDGVVCHCECGVPDPDCDSPDLLVSGCTNNEICTAAGTCSNCGNAHVDSGEACDVALPATAECGPLGYQPGQVPCNAECAWAFDQCAPLATCGNGSLDAPELCDGTQIQAGLDCTDYSRAAGTLACKAGCQIDTSGCYTCGDGRVEGPEACDDHGITAGDGCSAACAVETGWQCAGAPSACAPKCGDGMRVGTEACDDGNAASGDGCSASCAVEQDCSCSGTPSTCSCATTQLIATTTQSIDVGALALDGFGQPHASYYYAVDYTDPVTNYSMEHGHAIYAQRPGSSWLTSEIQTWDQTRTVMDPEDFQLVHDGGTLRAYFQRIYNTGNTFAVATRTGSSWSLSYGSPYYIYDVVRAGSSWHALVAGSGIGDFRYYMGSPGSWTRDEQLTGFNTSYANKLAVTSTGDVYIASMLPASGHASYSLKLAKRLNGTVWAPVYDVQTTGTCVYPVSHQPLALANGDLIVFEDGFAGSGQRWLRAHRNTGTSWVVEDIADLSWLPYTSCTAGGSSWSTLRKVSAADQLGRPHILFASQPQNNSTTFEDHYRDATGWHVRKFPITKGTPLAMVIDANGTTHILAIAPSTTPSTTRILYIRITANAWSN